MPEKLDSGEFGELCAESHEVKLLYVQLNLLSSLLSPQDFLYY